MLKPKLEIIMFIQNPNSSEYRTKITIIPIFQRIMSFLFNFLILRKEYTEISKYQGNKNGYSPGFLRPYKYVGVQGSLHASGVVSHLS